MRAYFVAFALLFACEQGTTPSPDPAPTASSEDSEPRADKRADAKPRHEDASFVVSLEGSPPYTVGKEAAIEAVLEARPPYKCNAEYPYKFKLDPPPEGVRYASEVVRDIDKSDARSVMRIPFTAESAGKKTIGGTFYFSVCNKEHCKIDKRPMELTVDVPSS